MDGDARNSKLGNGDNDFTVPITKNSLTQIFY